MTKLKAYSFFTFVFAIVLAYAVWALTAVIEPNLREYATPSVASTNPKTCTDAAFGETCTPTQSPLMFTKYLACSSKAEAQVLSQSEVIACMQAYMVVKLSFISGLELEKYHGMPPEERAEINRRAFKAYRKWRDENPSLVITLLAKP